MVLFWSTAELIFDINFIIQIILIILLVIGATQKQTWKYHGTIMGVATISMLITVLIIMGPSLGANMVVLLLFPTNPGSIVTIVHVVFGSLALILGLFFTIRFLYFAISKRPLICGTRIQMRIQIAIWFLSFLFGLIFYVYYYLI
ncbi:MAG: hypothetical protein ACXADB_00260 [Candidatus Hermodarchaeia archaeon]|jgi:hypothetical protein